MHLIKVYTLLAALVSTVYSVTRKQDAEFAQECVNMITRNEQLIASFVRLSLHDCISGCDGCVDTSMTDDKHGDRVNAGLEDPIKVINAAYKQNVSSIASRADFYAKCGQVAAEAGRRKASGPRNRGFNPSQPSDLPILMRYGRKDCKESPREQAADHPDPRSGLNGVLSWCSRVFSFTRQECVAILGAHTLGRARGPAASGYRFPWTKKSFVLDNEYYRDLVSTEQNWQQINVARPRFSPRWQYTSQAHLMLNVDMCLLKDIEPDNNGRYQKSLNDTDDSATASIIRQYAVDNIKWLRDFGKAFGKMIETGQTGKLTDVVGGSAAIPSTNRLGGQRPFAGSPKPRPSRRSPPTRPFRRPGRNGDVIGK